MRLHKYRIEDGNFRTDEEISRTNRRKAEACGITLYDNFYVEKKLGNGNTFRLFKNREEVNLLCLMEGAFPEKSGEIAVDRMYADNNAVRVGDRMRFGRYDFTVTGLVAFPDYSALFQDNNDTMFDAVKFGIGAVCAEDFARFPSDQLVYSYSWMYAGASDGTADRTADGASNGIPAGGVFSGAADDGTLRPGEEKAKADRLMEDLTDIIYLEDFVPRYLNQAIRFTGEDMGGDRAMMLILLYIVIVIMAFVFVITIRDTIAREAAVIGTLRASGFTKGELVRHYMALPLMVTLAAALIGNVLGYSFFKDVCADLYYSSYSLPTYTTVWNEEAFLLTTVVPLLIMLVTTFLTLWRSLLLSPCSFCTGS